MDLVDLVRLSTLMVLVLPDGGFGQWGVENTRHILRVFRMGSVIIDVDVIAFCLNSTLDECLSEFPCHFQFQDHHIITPRKH